MKREFKLDEIDAIAKEVIHEIESAKTDGAVVVALSGELGAGKTTLTQSIAHKLGVKENLISPTFVIMKSYIMGGQDYLKYGRKNHSNRPISNSPALHPSVLVHIDAYRLDSEKELETLGWAEMVNNQQNIILIEWPERVPKLIPKDAIRVNLEHIDEQTRMMELV